MFHYLHQGKNPSQSKGATFTRQFQTLGSNQYCCFQLVYVCSLLSKNVKVRIYKTVILPVVLYVCETRSLTLKEDID
jgi:hypothetical protein